MKTSVVSNLILTGWSKSAYLAAAATALESLNGQAHVAGVSMESLAERKEDIREIADGWWLDMCWVHLSDAQLDALCDYSYPGNVRELLNILDRARALEESDFAKLISEHKRINCDLFESVSNSVSGSVPSSSGSVPSASGSVPSARTSSYVGTDPAEQSSVGTDPAAPVGTDTAEQAYPDNLTAATRQHVKSVFDKYNHNLTATKNALGISVNTLKKYLA